MFRIPAPDRLVVTARILVVTRLDLRVRRSRSVSSRLMSVISSVPDPRLRCRRRGTGGSGPRWAVRRCADGADVGPRTRACLSSIARHRPSLNLRLACDRIVVVGGTGVWPAPPEHGESVGAIVAMPGGSLQQNLQDSRTLPTAARRGSGGVCPLGTRLPIGGALGAGSCPSDPDVTKGGAAHAVPRPPLLDSPPRTAGLRTHRPGAGGFPSRSIDEASCLDSSAGCRPSRRRSPTGSSTDPAISVRVETSSSE